MIGWIRRALATLLKRLRQPRVYYCVVRGRTKFIGMAKLEPFTSRYPNPILEPGDLWFATATTRGEAYWKITDEMIRLGYEKDVFFCQG
jgi:hypothetical protein